MLFRSLTSCARSLDLDKAGTRMPARIAIMAMTTRSSISVKARVRMRWGFMPLAYPCDANRVNNVRLNARRSPARQPGHAVDAAGILQLAISRQLFASLRLAPPIQRVAAPSEFHERNSMAAGAGNSINSNENY